ncbi:UNVERIFIED_CONTAM: hypothetical protein FKN15_055675 [Acipenser sinensis]
MNTRCPPKRVPSAVRFFTRCRLTVQPPQSYSIGGQRSSGQLTSLQEPGLTTGGRWAQDATDLLSEDLVQKKLPLLSLSVSMAESCKDFDGDSSIRRVLEMCCYVEKTLAKVLADFEVQVEKEVLEPLNKLSEDIYSADLYHFATKEYDYANYFIRFPAISCSSLHYKISYKPPSTKVYLQGWESDSRCTAVETLMLDMATASSVQVVKVIEPLVQFADRLFPGDVDFDTPVCPSVPTAVEKALPPPQEKTVEKPAVQTAPSTGRDR